MRQVVNRPSAVWRLSMPADPYTARVVLVEHDGQAWRENRPGSEIQLIADPTASVSGLALLNQVCEPGVGAPSHTHEFEEILTVLEGSAEIWIGAERHTVGPGTSVFVPTGAVHGFVAVGDARLKLQAAIAAHELRAQFLES
jgi:quercetin dioxygenase-like cupin family protein